MLVMASAFVACACTLGGNGGIAARTTNSASGRADTNATVTTSTKPVPSTGIDVGIGKWKQPKVDMSDWQLAIVHLNDKVRMTYMAPFRWSIDSRGRGQSLDGLVKASGQWTTIDNTQMSLAAYAASLANGEPVHAITTDSGYVAYATEREVSVAPTDPNVERFMFHTAVVDIDGRIAKLEVRYNATDRWRFHDLANAVLGSIEIVEE